MKRITLLASLLLATAAASAASASEYKWIGQITEDGAALRYAIPESDGIRLDFHCERKTRNIVVHFEHEPKDAKDGMKGTIRLSLRGRDAGLSVDIPAAGDRSQLDDAFFFKGEIRMSPNLRRILSEGGTLVVTVGSYAEEIPLKGIARELRPLLTSCP